MPDNSAISRALVGSPMTLQDLVAANQQANPLVGLMSSIPGAPAVVPAQETKPAPAAAAKKYQTYVPGNVEFAEAAPKRFARSETYDHETRGGPFKYTMALVPDGGKLHAVVHSVMKETGRGDIPLHEAVNKNRARNILAEIRHTAHEELPDYAEQETHEARWNSLSPEEKAREMKAERAERHKANALKGQEIHEAISKALSEGWNPQPHGDHLYNYYAAPEAIKAFASPNSMARVDAILHQKKMDAGDLRSQLLDLMDKARG